MSETNTILTNLKDEIEQDRDELILKAYLLKANTKDEIEKLEKQWHQFKGHSQQVVYEAKKASGDIFTATKLLGEELKTGYKRIVKSL
jgi:hypothetical protein